MQSPLLLTASAVLFTSLSLYAQQPAAATPNEPKGVPPRAAPTDYQAQAKAGDVTIAADFMGHSVPTPDAVYNTEDYVIVEVGLFGSANSKLQLNSGDFTLRVNGKKSALTSEPAEVVLHTLKDPNWVPDVPPEQKSSKTSIGGGGRQPGDPPPLPPKMPMELQHVMRQRVQHAALLGGERTLPQAGLLFFQYHGKAPSIKSVELIYNGPAGPATITLQP